jgi:hypothetical protein
MMRLHLSVKFLPPFYPPFGKRSSICGLCGFTLNRDYRK